MSRSKARGTAFETAIVNWLIDNGFEAARRIALAGSKDTGDIDTGRGVNLEAKNCKTITLAGWVEEAEQESRNANGRPVVTVIKRRGKGSPGEAYVVMPLKRFVNFL